MIYKARKIKASGLYHFTKTKNGETKAVGYCGSISCDKCQERAKCKYCGKGYVATEQCPGHVTADESLAHYLKYISDSAWYHGRIEPDSPCCICREDTSEIVTYGPGKRNFYVLCNKHHSKETLLELLHKTGLDYSNV
jgi:hypothetical protein